MKKKAQQAFQNLQSRSDAEKQTFAFMSALCITAIIAVFWVVDFSTDISIQSAQRDKEIKELNTASPFDIVRSQVDNFTLEGFTE